ncbi:hypothetical protein Tcan_05378 [Toxocara canis]|uniref:Uncharacterized protein n=1 Tax=Toxocara canis TaxID=6265 RepID=A0A0B2VRP8_TOXCA|nr:hypothetical protein Tcan_05378 [Toxocara canis]
MQSQLVGVLQVISNMIRFWNGEQSERWAGGKLASTIAHINEFARVRNTVQHSANGVCSIWSRQCTAGLKRVAVLAVRCKPNNSIDYALSPSETLIYMSEGNVKLTEAAPERVHSQYSEQRREMIIKCAENDDHGIEVALCNYTDRGYRSSEYMLDELNECTSQYCAPLPNSQREAGEATKRAA